LGLMVALGLGLVDAVWNLGLRQFGRVSIRVLVGVLVGAVGGLLGGLLGHFLNWLSGGFLFTLAWAFTGLLVGVSIGAFEVLAAFITRREGRAARKKLVKCMVGGTIGGFLGGLVAWLFRLAFASLFASKNEQWLW